RQHPQQPADQQRRIHGQEHADGHPGPYGGIHRADHHLAASAQFARESLANGVHLGSPPTGLRGRHAGRDHAVVGESVPMYHGSHPFRRVIPDSACYFFSSFVTFFFFVPKSSSFTNSWPPSTLSLMSRWISCAIRPNASFTCVSYLAFKILSCS